jgi:hypothetical protein
VNQAVQPVCARRDAMACEIPAPLQAPWGRHYVHGHRGPGSMTRRPMKHFTEALQRFGPHDRHSGARQE